MGIKKEKKERVHLQHFVVTRSIFLLEVFHHLGSFRNVPRQRAKRHLILTIVVEVLSQVLDLLAQARDDSLGSSSVVSILAPSLDQTFLLVAKLVMSLMGSNYKEEL